MNAPQSKSSLFISLAAILGSFLILAALVMVMQRYTRPAPVNQARIDERRKILADVRQAGAEGLDKYGWIDEAKGIARLKIDHAMDLVVQGYQNPAAYHTNMLSRVEKANAVPPPPVNQFE